MRPFEHTALYIREVSKVDFTTMTPKERAGWRQAFNERHALCDDCDGTGRDTWDRVSFDCSSCKGTGKTPA